MISTCCRRFGRRATRRSPFNSRSDKHKLWRALQGERSDGPTQDRPAPSPKKQKTTAAAKPPRENSKAALVVGLPVFIHWCRTVEVPSPGLWIFAGTLFMLGLETIFAAFLVGILELQRESQRQG